MKIPLTVEYAGGTSKEIFAGAADMVAFENKFDVSIGTISESPRMTHLYYLAWHAEKRTKGTNLEFEAWLETVESVGGNDADPK